MINIGEMIQKVKSEGYSETMAQAKVCQDIILILISKANFHNNITVKGGVVMRSISNNVRRATQDIDIDFIKYSLQNDSIIAFINRLNSLGIVSIKINGEIEELKQQDYHGKRVYVTIHDNYNNSLSSKMDLGVHKNLDILQEEYCFDVCADDVTVSLLINSKEQMLVEKLRSILVFGPFSTRFKDIYDIYYLSRTTDKKKLCKALDVMVFSDVNMKENSIDDIINRVELTFKNKIYLKNLSTSRKNWLNIDNERVIDGIIKFLYDLKEYQQTF